MALTGRKRAAAPITLPIGYRADASGRLVEKIGPVPPEVRNNVTAFIRQKRVQAVVESDLLGLARGIKRPKSSPEKPTFERLAQAHARGETLDKRQLQTERGESGGGEITEIVPQLRMLHRRRTISSSEYAAGLQLCRDWHGAGFRGPATVNYEPRRPGSVKKYYESEHVTDCRQRVYYALRSVPKALHEATSWVIASMGDGIPLYELGARYLRPEEEVSQPNESALSTRGAVILRITLAILCDHYRIDHRWLHRPSLSPQAQAIASMIPDINAETLP